MKNGNFPVRTHDEVFVFCSGCLQHYLSDRKILFPSCCYVLPRLKRTRPKTLKKISFAGRKHEINENLHPTIPVVLGLAREAVCARRGASPFLKMKASRIGTKLARTSLEYLVRSDTFEVSEGSLSGPWDRLT